MRLGQTAGLCVDVCSLDVQCFAPSIFLWFQLFLIYPHTLPSPVNESASFHRKSQRSEHELTLFLYHVTIMLQLNENKLFRVKCQMFLYSGGVYGWHGYHRDSAWHNQVRQNTAVVKHPSSPIRSSYEIPTALSGCICVSAVTKPCPEPAGVPSIHRKVGALRRKKRAYLAYLKTRFHLCKWSERGPWFEFEFAVACSILLLCCCNVWSALLEWGGVEGFLGSDVLFTCPVMWKMNQSNAYCCLCVCVYL